MSPSIPNRPKPYIAGLVPTLNNRGFMAETLDHYSKRFADAVCELDAEVLDMGCAYGIATRAALENGASVCACDMEEGHVRILEHETPEHLRERLRVVVGALPDIDFPDQSFGAILCSRLLHFLQPDEIRVTLEKMCAWLRPAGHVYLVADTPYTGFWFSTAGDYERRKADGEEWPGFIADIGPLLASGKPPAGMLPYLNPLDPDILRRECERAGLEVVEAAFASRDGGSAGREHAGCIACKT